ncbi:MFS transporter [Pseudomonas sp. LP_7_YM]|uniref:MFS transporter n=1 Tax=Pseudomonas sp. LP_7_YM TaxID=2485137 RepID=UPI0010612BF4|nr:MFS transporter [Pseudomonas sp. LP_7_YM]TDV72529.1 transmembrane secretion effector [Pseudomonas sp. LP_7_YM]
MKTVTPRTFFINRNFLLLWLGQALSSFGEFLVNAVVTVWLVSDLLADDSRLPLAIGLTVAAATLPRIFIAPLAGAWIDSARPVRVMVIADAVRIFASLLFMAAYESANLTPWQTLCGVSLWLLINATAAQFFNPARACLMQIAIPEERRIEASAKAMFSLTGVGILSSALGPSLFAWVGAMSAFVLATLGLAGSGFCVLRTTGLAACIESSLPTEPYWRALVSGVRLAWSHRTIRLMMLGTALYGISLGINNPVLPLFGMQTLALEPSAYGVLMAAFPLGGLSATLLSPWLSRRLRAETLTCGALFLLGLANLAFALSSGRYVPMLTMYLSGMCFATYAVAQGPVLQMHIPAGYMGRISSLSNPVLSIASVLATAGVTAALSHSQAALWVVSELDANTLALSVSAIIVLVGGALMLYSVRRPASAVEMARANQ